MRQGIDDAKIVFGSQFRVEPKAFQRGVQELFARLQHVAVDLLGVAKHLVDAGTRNHVVKLVQQHQAPQALQLSTRHRRAGQPARGTAHQFDVAQQLFAAAIVALVVGLRRVGAAMILKVELAAPLAQRTVLTIALATDVSVGANQHTLGCAHFDLIKKLGWRRKFDFRQARRRLTTRETVQHFAIGTAATVAVTKQHQTMVRAILVFVVLFRFDKVARSGVRVVGVGRRKMNNHTTAINTAPRESGATMKQEKKKILKQNWLNAQTLAFCSLDSNSIFE